MARLLVRNGTVVTTNDDRDVIEDGAVLVQDDRIVAVGPSETVESDHGATEVLDAEGGVVLPGLISTHVHVSDILLRGGPNTNRGLYDWLYNVKVPGITAMTVEEHRVAAALYCTEAVRSGVTTFVENAIGRGAGFDHDVVEAKLEVYESSGIRSVYAQAFSDVPIDDDVESYLERVMAREPGVNHVWPETVDTEEAIRNVESLIEEYHGSADGRQSVWPAPYLTWGVSPEGFRRAYDLAERHDVMTTTHVSETPFQERGPMSSIEYLNNVDYLGERALLGHCVHVDDRDIRLLSATGTNVAHNPLTNLALADGIAPVPEMLDRDVTVALGTDNASANDAVNLLGDARYAALLHRGNTADPGVLTAQQVLEMATIEAARAIGREDDLGSIEPGKKADLVVVDLDRPHLAPRPDVRSAIVYQTRGSEFEAVICDGEVVMQDGRVDGIAEMYDDLPDLAMETAAEVRDRAGIPSPKG